MSVPSWTILPLGPVVGSWLGVLIRRWPAGRGSVWGRSACDSCGRTLSVAELVPILSFLALRGRCSACGARIGWFAPGIELAALLVAALSLLSAGASASAPWLDAALGWALLTAAWIDAETFWLPDRITLPLILAGLAVTAADDPAALYNHALAAALGYIGFRLLNAAFRAVRRHDGLGAGDAKLLAAAGAWLGLAALPSVIVIAAGIGIIAIGLRRFLAPDRGLDQPIPFGPALAAAFFCWRLAG